MARTIQQRLTDEGLGDVRVTSTDQQIVLELPASRRGQRARIEALVEGPGQLWVAVATPDGEVDRRLRAVLAADPEVVAANALVIDEESGQSPATADRCRNGRCEVRPTRCAAS